MESNIIPIIVGIIAIAVGVILGKLIFAKNTIKQVEEATQHSQNIIKEAELRAETIKKEKELDAKEKFVLMKAAHDKEVLQRNQKILESEARIKQKEQSINQKETNVDKQVKDNEAIKETLDRKSTRLNSSHLRLSRMPSSA